MRTSESRVAGEADRGVTAGRVVPPRLRASDVLGGREEHALEFSCFFNGVVGPLGHALTLTPTPCATKVGSLPSSGVVAAAVIGTTSPSDSLPARCRFALGLSVAFCPDEGRRGGSVLFRVRLSLRASLSTPEVSCARMQSHVPVSTDAVCCLRRDMSGSATSPFRVLISRGCKVHAFALRPATLLPSQAPYSTLRALDAPLRRRALTPHPGPATRLSGDYRDGTFTRKSDTTGNPALNERSVSVRTHHAAC